MYQMNNKKRNIVKKNQNIVNIDPAFNDKLLRNGLKKEKKIELIHTEIYKDS